MNLSAFSRTLTVPFLFAGALLGQTAKPAVHHPATAAHRTVARSTCAVELPVLSPKIPALTPANVCPKALYTLAYVDTKIGTGELAQPRKWYTVHYTGYLPDGSKFDSSLDHPGAEPITFPYGAHQVIVGWDTGFEGMHVGGKRRLFIPYELAYGENGRPPVIPAKAELIFDVELVGISDTPPKPKTVAPPAQPQPASSAKPATETNPATEAQPAVTPSGASTTPSGISPKPEAAPDANSKPKL